MSEEKQSIGRISVTKVHPDMVRLYNEETADAVTLKEFQLESVLQLVLSNGGAGSSGGIKCAHDIMISRQCLACGRGESSFRVATPDALVTIPRKH